MNQIIVRQVGAKYRAGENVVLGKDYTLNAKIPGIVEFDWDAVAKKRVVHVRPPLADMPRPKTIDVTQLTRTL